MGYYKNIIIIIIIIIIIMQKNGYDISYDILVEKKNIYRFIGIIVITYNRPAQPRCSNLCNVFYG